MQSVQEEAEGAAEYVPEAQGVQAPWPEVAEVPMGQGTGDAVPPAHELPLGHATPLAVLTSGQYVPAAPVQGVHEVALAKE